MSRLSGSVQALAGALLACALSYGLAGCNSSTTVEMKMDVSGLPASPPSATANSPNAGHFYFNGFPTDLRLQEDGRIQIDDFPRRFHILTNTYVKAIEKYNHIGGYHTISPIYLPFTGAIDVSALPDWDPEFAREDSPIQVVDVDPDSPEYGRRFPLDVSMTEKMDSYRPQDLLQIIPTFGINLRPDTTYAALVTDQVPVPEGNHVQQNRALGLVLDDVQAPELSDQAWSVYAPLRDYLAQQGMDPAGIIGATVWTTGDPTRVLLTAADKVAQMATAPAENLLLLEDYPDYCVIEGYVDTPGFQKGVIPYVLTGGQVEYDDQGAPLQQYSRKAKFVVTIPKHQPMPDSGFPMLFYHHGAGGNADQVFTRGEYVRTAIDIVVPYKVLERGNGPSQVAAERGWASSGFAGHMSLDHVGLGLGYGMFGYNVFNPVSLYNNYYQMVWERVYFRRFLNQLEVEASLCPDADPGAGRTAFRIDPQMQMLMGQSLGNWTSSLQLVADPEPFEGVLFTGMAGTWIKLFTNSAQFRSAMSAGVVSLLPGQKLDDAHPFLMLMEWLMGGADPVAHLDTVLRYPNKTAPHILAISGIDDSGSGEHVQRIHMLATGVDLLGPDLGDTYDTTLFPHLEIGGALQLDYPGVNNVDVPGQGARTAVVVRHENDVRPDHNGHHVTFDLDATKHQYGCFMEHLAQGRAPVVGAGYEQGGPCL